MTGTIKDSERILWNASIAKSPPTVTYASLMGDEKSSTQEKDKDKEEEGRERGMKKLLEKVVSTDCGLLRPVLRRRSRSQS
jgi:hypothetical protein